MKRPAGHTRPGGLLRACCHELAATATLCVLAMLAAAGSGAGDPGRLATAGGYGLAVVAVLHVFGSDPVHLNPAVTLALRATGRSPLPQLAIRWLGQAAGAVVAGLVARWLLEFSGSAMGVPVGTLTKTDALKTVCVEALLAAIWSGAHVAAVATGRTATLPLLVGLTVVATALAGQPFTGAAMNPARALAAAVAAWDVSTLAVYVAGPLAGGAAAGLLGRGIVPAASRRPGLP